MNDLDPNPLPSDLEAESALLGSLLLGGRAALDECEGIERGSFWDQSHGDVWEAAVDLLKRGEQIDIVALASLLRDRGQYEAIGGSGLKLLLEAVPTHYNASFYARIVRDKALKRRLVFSLQEQLRTVYADPETSAQDIADKASTAIREVAESSVSGGWVTVKELLPRVVARDKSVAGWSTSVPSLQRVVARFRPGEFIVIAARPGHGKTSLMRTLALDGSGFGQVLVFSLEEGDEYFAASLVAGESGVSKAGLMDGELEPGEWDAVYERCGWMDTNLRLENILLDPDPRVSPSQIIARVRKRARKGPIAMVLIDYLQLLRDDTRRWKSRHEELGFITRSLKILAREVGAPVVVGSQLNRSNQQGPVHTRRPRMSDLRDSGAIESDADVILGVFNWFREDSEAISWAKGVVEVNDVKQRADIGGRCVLGMTGATVYEPDPDHARRYREECQAQSRRSTTQRRYGESSYSH